MVIIMAVQLIFIYMAMGLVLVMIKVVTESAITIAIIILIGTVSVVAIEQGNEFINNNRKWPRCENFKTASALYSQYT